mgnify:CR=1 FL=1
MPEVSETISAIAMGIALSACCGFRIFIPLLAASLAGYFQWISLPDTVSWMGSLTSVICFVTAALLEIAAYYIPFVDNLSDLIATPLAAGAGTLVAYSILPGQENNELLQWILAMVAGGVSAGTIQSGTGLLRLASTKFTAGTGNALVATGENAAAIGGVALSFMIPVLMVIFVVLLIIWILRKLFIGKAKKE